MQKFSIIWSIPLVVLAIVVAAAWDAVSVAAEGVVVGKMEPASREVPKYLAESVREMVFTGLVNSPAFKVCTEPSPGCGWRVDGRISKKGGYVLDFSLVELASNATRETVTVRSEDEAGLPGAMAVFPARLAAAIAALAAPEPAPEPREPAPPASPAKLHPDRLLAVKHPSQEKAQDVMARPSKPQKPAVPEEDDEDDAAFLPDYPVGDEEPPRTASTARAGGKGGGTSFLKWPLGLFHKEERKRAKEHEGHRVSPVPLYPTPDQVFAEAPEQPQEQSPPSGNVHSGGSSSSLVPGAESQPAAVQAAGDAPEDGLVQSTPPAPGNGPLWQWY